MRVLSLHVICQSKKLTLGYWRIFDIANYTLLQTEWRGLSLCLLVGLSICHFREPCKNG